MKSAVLYVILICAASISAKAQLFGANSDLSKAEVYAATETVRPGDRLPVAVRLTMSEGWYTYAEEPGDSGMPPSIRITGPFGIQLDTWRFPPHQTFTDALGTSYGYKSEVVFLGDLLIPESVETGIQLELEVLLTWMICRDICVLQSDTKRLMVKTGSETPEPGEEWKKILQQGGWRK